MHGDYLDTRIRNSPAELDQYPPEFDQLLDRIFGEFGLVVCGWSAEWDSALRKAIYPCVIAPVHDLLGGPGSSQVMRPNG